MGRLFGSSSYAINKAIADLVDSAPETLDTLSEAAEAIARVQEESYSAKLRLDDFERDRRKKLTDDLNIYIDPIKGSDEKGADIYANFEFAMNEVRANFFPNNKNIIFNFAPNCDHVIDREITLANLNTANTEYSQVILRGDPTLRDTTRIILRGNRARLEAKQCSTFYVIQDLTFVGESILGGQGEKLYPALLRIIQSSSISILDVTVEGEFGQIFIAANFGYLRQRRITLKNVDARQAYFAGNGGKLDLNESQPLIGTNVWRDCFAEVYANGSVFIGGGTSFEEADASRTTRVPGETPGTASFSLGQKFRIHIPAQLEINNKDFTINNFPGSIEGEYIWDSLEKTFASLPTEYLNGTQAVFPHGWIDFNPDLEWYEVSVWALCISQQDGWLEGDFAMPSSGFTVWIDRENIYIQIDAGGISLTRKGGNSKEISIDSNNWQLYVRAKWRQYS